MAESRSQAVDLVRCEVRGLEVMLTSQGWRCGGDPVVEEMLNSHFPPKRSHLPFGVHALDSAAERIEGFRILEQLDSDEPDENVEGRVY